MTTIYREFVEEFAPKPWFQEIVLAFPSKPLVLFCEFFEGINRIFHSLQGKTEKSIPEAKDSSVELNVQESCPEGGDFSVLPMKGVE